MSTTQTVHHPMFARLWVAMSSHETELITRLRRENLDGLTGRVLEIGAGAGTNFAYYPDTVEQVVAIEPEEHLFEHAQRAGEAEKARLRTLSREQLVQRAMALVEKNHTFCAFVDQGGYSCVYFAEHTRNTPDNNQS